MESEKAELIEIEYNGGCQGGRNGEMLVKGDRLPVIRRLHKFWGFNAQHGDYSQ